MMVTLDVERFRKIDALASGGATAGERAAALSRLDVIAKAAGMSVAQAREAATESPARNWTDAFRDIFDTPEHRARQAEREQERQRRMRQLLDEYGSEDAVFEPCERERALIAACRPFKVTRETTGWSTGSLSGWNGGRTLPRHIRDAIVVKLPLPADVAGLWSEHVYWEKRADDRCAFEPDIDETIEIRARKHILESRLDTMVARTRADLLARLSWMQHLNRRDWHRDRAEDEELLDTLQADIERIVADPVQTGQLASPPSQEVFDAVERTPVRTAGDRRQTALGLLSNPDTSNLSDREIARRVGISPTTVGTLRRKAVGLSKSSGPIASGAPRSPGALARG